MLSAILDHADTGSRRPARRSLPDFRRSMVEAGAPRFGLATRRAVRNIIWFRDGISLSGDYHDSPDCRSRNCGELLETEFKSSLKAHDDSAGACWAHRDFVCVSVDHSKLL